MSERSVVHLKDRQKGALVEATFIDGVTEAEVILAESRWKPFLDEQIRRMQAAGVPKEKLPQHRHWDWRQKFEAVEGYAAYQMFGIECEGEMQGLMLVSTAGKVCRAESHKGKSLVYVHFLAAAPWNLPSIVPEPRYSLVGTILVAAAIQLSLEEEFSGRIGLHSLPQADNWYSDACGMTDLGCDPTSQNLRYFEMTAEQASEFLKEAMQ
jgi:hypothetical protein